MSELDRIRERVRQNRATSQTISDEPGTPGPAPTSFAGGAFVAGDRIFDRVTGQGGTVSKLAAFGGAPPGTVNVNLDGGAFVERQPSQLVKRPTLPPAEK